MARVANFSLLVLLLASCVVGQLASQLGACDPLVPESCLLPFPNSFWLAEADSFPGSYTGLRVDFKSTTFPANHQGDRVDPVVGGYNDLDGFSPAAPMCAYFGDVSMENVAGHRNISASLNADSPTILLDTETMQLLPHWSELDYSTKHTQDRMFMMWPAQRLDSGKRYIAAMRNLVTNRTGALVQPSDAFLSLRDNLNSTDPDVYLRQQQFEEIFSLLQEAGVDRSSLQLAWDFTTGSEQSITGKLLFMRDDMLTRIPDDGPAYYIDDVEDDPSDYSARLVHGLMEVPMYMDSCKPGSHLVLDSNGIPVFQGYCNVTFSVQIPNSLVERQEAGIVMQYGHGLLYDQQEITQTYLQKQADVFGYVIAGTNWWGLDEFDIPAIVEMMLFNMTDFSIVPDRCQQGVVNQVALTRLVMGAFASDPSVTFNGVSVIDPTRHYYNGNSLGGIMGGVLMGVSPDLSRGVLGVGGAPFSLLLPRSLDFAEFFDILKLKYGNAFDRMNTIFLMQQLWDRSDPGGYMSYITSDTLPSTPAKLVSLNYGLGDAQVSWLGMFMYARSMNAKMFPNNVREDNEVLYGFEVVEDDGPVTEGAVVQGWNFGSPTVPQVNIPPSSAYDTHECTRRDPRVIEQIHALFAKGEIVDFCKGVGCNPLSPQITLDKCPEPDM